MMSFLLSTLILSGFTNTVISAYSLAQPAIQHRRHFNQQRSLYQGGWPLGLSGEGSPSCPANASVACPTTNYLNAGCCPAGQYCFVAASQDYQYCCPNDSDCSTAVTNFPVCADSSWNMFQANAGGYFCCESGQIGVNSIGQLDGLCEPSSQDVPASLLATLVNQVTTSTAAPSSAATVGSGPTANSITTGPPAETNPTAPTVESSSVSAGTNPPASSSSSNKQNTIIAIVGSIVIGAVILVVVLIVKWYRRRFGYTLVEPTREMMIECWNKFGPQNNVQPSAAELRQNWFVHYHAMRAEQNSYYDTSGGAG